LYDKAQLHYFDSCSSMQAVAAGELLLTNSKISNTLSGSVNIDQVTSKTASDYRKHRTIE
jgi:hypothetical protein